MTGIPSRLEHERTRAKAYQKEKDRWLVRPRHIDDQAPSAAWYASNNDEYVRRMMEEHSDMVVPGWGEPAPPE